VASVFRLPSPTFLQVPAHIAPSPVRHHKASQPAAELAATIQALRAEGLAFASFTRGRPQVRSNCASTKTYLRFIAVHETAIGTQENVSPASGGSAYRGAAEACRGCVGQQPLTRSESRACWRVVDVPYHGYATCAQSSGARWTIPTRCCRPTRSLRRLSKTSRRHWKTQASGS